MPPPGKRALDGSFLRRFDSYRLNGSDSGLIHATAADFARHLVHLRRQFYRRA